MLSTPACACDGCQGALDCQGGEGKQSISSNLQCYSGNDYFIAGSAILLDPFTCFIMFMSTKNDFMDLDLFIDIACIVCKLLHF